MHTRAFRPALEITRTTRLYSAVPRCPRLHTLSSHRVFTPQVAESLACLPIFLAGCESLLVLGGPVYTSRL